MDELLELKRKIYEIISGICEDENGEWEKTTNAIMNMLDRDYDIDGLLEKNY